MNVSCDSNENICEATITINFPCKQTMMKHDKFNQLKEKLDASHSGIKVLKDPGH